MTCVSICFSFFYPLNIDSRTFRFAYIVLMPNLCFPSFQTCLATIKKYFHIAKTKDVYNKKTY